MSKPTMSAKRADKNAQMNQFRREARERNIASPTRQMSYITARICGQSPDDAHAIATGDECLLNAGWPK